MASVELVQVAKRYGKQSVLHPLDLTIPDGSFTVLVGPSGCGKSTLLRLLAGLDTVSDGAIMLDKKRINDLDPADRISPWYSRAMRSIRTSPLQRIWRFTCR